jgi:hypothetical protein
LTKEVQDWTVYYFAELTLVSGIVWGMAGLRLQPDDPFEFHVALSFYLG